MSSRARIPLDIVIQVLDVRRWTANAISRPTTFSLARTDHTCSAELKTAGAITAAMAAIGALLETPSQIVANRALASQPPQFRLNPAPNSK